MPKKSPPQRAEVLVNRIVSNLRALAKIKGLSESQISACIASVSSEVEGAAAVLNTSGSSKAFTIPNI